jgi:hypothetical protein
LIKLIFFNKISHPFNGSYTSAHPPLATVVESGDKKVVWGEGEEQMPSLEIEGMAACVKILFCLRLWI